MLIYPDSSDLINLCRGMARLSISEHPQRLAAHSHRLVIFLDALIDLGRMTVEAAAPTILSDLVCSAPL
jgi:hypothetical protein